MNTEITGEPPPSGARATLAEDERTARRMVSTFGLPRVDVDDVIQEVLIALEAGRAGFRVPAGKTRAAAWRSFVWGVVVRQVAHYRRARARQRNGERGAFEEAEVIAPSVEEVFLSEARHVLLRQAVDALAPLLRAVLELHLAGLRMPAAAATLAVPCGTAWTRFRYACESVRATMERWDAEEMRRQRAAKRTNDGSRVWT